MMDIREKVARIIAPEEWEWYDKLPNGHRMSFMEQGLGELKAADRLIEAGLIKETE